MSRIRILVGTKKGASFLSADGRLRDWKVSGPHFAGWEIYHLRLETAESLRLVPAAE